ncbi:hydrogenase maturation nickel metallochaperone HypA [Vulgatibacter incomptus]|uniref:Hydrogenase maturation factor HypA n=1 Tax=Vulgatibacter incomptus TaxID=1391653 RepID=A0A0K1P9F7_9BACT|nr:hydrogenase maturation nickel metallochaperone HypA [Vulgatibacter incomptus]AKU90147.1 [NiFe] hydrogenase nickel incorporation protein HypA [Vulgatibacter incomptus]
MHELALIESLVESVEAGVGGQRVAAVRLEVGRLTAVDPGALQFCFELCVAGTCLEGARLEIREVPGRALCRHCGAEVDVEATSALCPCGAAELQVISGEELRLKEVEVA